ncbi:AI-2E family transporter [Miniphocaeibacter massiliensis]|uniref:AI-2E family transporter n=1 Tax=Miniphocaeibacter massiliensis TaxID=2041841 RepID=UPI0013EC1C6C|nr:AI-2E family transporter [Miniphocaeibacter massiliensis]
MKIINYIKVYFDEILIKTKRNMFAFFKFLSLFTLISIVITFIGFKIIGIDNSVLKSIFAGVFSFFPLIGSGVVFIPWIIVKLFLSGKVLAIELSILFTILIIARQIIEPFLKGITINLRPAISFIIFIISYLINHTKGALIGMVLVFILSVIFELLDIEKYVLRHKRRVLKEHQEDNYKA